MLLTLATPASAEWFADVYGGASHTPRSDVVLVVRPGGADADHTFHDLKWSPSATFGARAGYWFDAAPWYGVGLDIFHFDANLPTQTVDTTISGVTAPAALQAIDFSVNAIAFDLIRLRARLMAGLEYPNGRLQPYVTAGPALFKTRVTNKGNSELSNRAVDDTSWGYKVGAGVSWHVSKAAALFGEYRFTHYHAEPMLDGTITGARVPMRFDLDTHHVIAGVSLRF
jgi:opacity protein-like surface antigen